MAIRAELVGRGRLETEVAGRVTRGGDPAPRAYIRILDRTGEFAAEVWCGPGGEFKLELPPGEWRLVCLAPKVRLEQMLHLDPGDHTEIEVSLPDDPAPTR